MFLIETSLPLLLDDCATTGNELAIRKNNIKNTAEWQKRVVLGASFITPILVIIKSNITRMIA
jgi:hypothetical protein